MANPLAMTISEILSRVFLFHFEKFLGHFSLFRVFWDVLVNTGRNSRFDLKKKFLKPKQICILYTEKPQNEKKKKKRKEMNKVTCTINYKFI